MNSKHWTTKLHTLPHRILDHPFSGAYALWMLLADAALRGGVTGSAEQMTALGSLGALTLAITAGRKPIVRQTVLRKVKNISKITERGSKVRSDIRAEGVALAFDALYQLESIDVTTRMVDALREVDRCDVTSWGFSHTHAPVSTPAELAAQLIDGALYSALANPPGLNGVLSKKVQKYLLVRHPEWVAEYPQHFSFDCVDRARPGLMTAALTVYGLTHTSTSRRSELKAWIERSEDRSLDDPSHQQSTMCAPQGAMSELEI
jgi:hypothetical protein